MSNSPLLPRTAALKLALFGVLALTEIPVAQAQYTTGMRTTPPVSRPTYNPPRSGSGFRPGFGIPLGVFIPYLQPRGEREIVEVIPRPRARQRTVRQQPAPHRARKEVAERPRQHLPVKAKQAGIPPVLPVLSGQPPRDETRFVKNEILLQTQNTVSAPALEKLSKAQKLQLMGTENFTLPGITLHRFKITDGRSVRQVISALERNRRIQSVQPNYIYDLPEPVIRSVTLGELRRSKPVEVPARQESIPPPPLAESEPSPPKQEGAAPVIAHTASHSTTAGDGALPQYSVTALRLPEAHGLARGQNILIAVIDSGIDQTHPELQGGIVRSFDGTDGVQESSHPHGTAMAGAITARAQLDSAAPAAQILAARVFSGQRQSEGAEGSTIHILRGLDWSYKQGARVINMSFAGPKDPLVQVSLGAAYEKKIVLVAAAGNAGPDAAPLYPAADPHVIGVAATDENNALFSAGNRGKHLAIAAPGVDVLVATPGAAYGMTSGTSVAAAQVSGLAALLLEKQPDLSTEDIRKLLNSTARPRTDIDKTTDTPAGLADAFKALTSLNPSAAVR